MAPLSQQLFLLLLYSLGLLLLPAGAQCNTQELYVKPTEDTPCPEPCHTLDEYVQNAAQYFVSNTTFNFLPGNHSLSQNLVVRNVINLVLVPTNGTADIIGHDFVGMQFFEITNLVLEDLSISCATFLLVDLFNLNLLRCNIDFTIYYPFLYFANIVGSSRIERLCINSCKLPQALQAPETTFYIQYTDNIKVQPSTHNQLTVKDCPLFGNFGSSFFLRARYALDLLLENITLSNGWLWILGNSSSVSLTFKNVTFSNFPKGILRLRNTSANFIDCRFLSSRAQLFADTDRSKANVVSLESSRSVNFTSCEFRDNYGSSIGAISSDFILSGSNTFSNNTAYRGAAMAFYGDSYVTLANGSDTHFINNSAETVGGVIYTDRDYEASKVCFFKLQAEFSCFQTALSLSFANNTAENGGDRVYGTALDTCQMSGHTDCEGWRFVSHVFNVSLHQENDLELSAITSDPIRACLCENGRPSCTSVFKSLIVYPGETFQISAVAVGDRFGTRDGSVYAQLLHVSSTTREVAGIEDVQLSQRVEKTSCTNLSYTILSNSSAATLVLTADSALVQQYPSSHDSSFLADKISRYIESGNIHLRLRSTPVFISVTLRPCPLGFMLSGEQPRCVCDAQLQKNHIPCDLTTQTVQRSGTQWINASFQNDSYNGVIVNKYCPNNYCKPETGNISLEQPDTQCAFTHSGILCGGCQSGLSLALGSARCLSCSNEYLSLLVPFALAGFALVFFIKLLNLTVAEGTLNGLIFYANIVRANQVTWIPEQDTNVLTVFIAWINLDLGIETCFFDGLDAYWKTWLQFVFPIYIWATVILIIVLSYYFSTAAKFFGSNSVQVLATLFLLSYPKLLRTIISILQASTLDYPDGTSVTVWSYDGNIHYLSLKLVPLFIVALAVTLFLWLPYTAIFCFAQCLQRVDNYRVTSVLMKLKPFLDANFGPFKDKHRYWVGLLLLVRGVLFIGFAATPTSRSEIGLLVTLAGVLCLLVYLSYIGQVYKKSYLSILENSFLLNLGMLAGGTLYVRLSGGSQSALAYTSVGIAFAQFVMIVAVHAVITLKETRLARRLLRQWAGLANPQTGDQPEYEGHAAEPIMKNQGMRGLVISYDDFREPVLKYSDTRT